MYVAIPQQLTLCIDSITATKMGDAVAQSLVRSQVKLLRVQYALAEHRHTKEYMESYPPYVVVEDVNMEEDWTAKRKLSRRHSAYESARSQMVENSSRHIVDLENRLYINEQVVAALQEKSQASAKAECVNVH